MQKFKSGIKSGISYKPWPTDREYLNDAKYENMIGWPLIFEPIPLAYSEIQIVNWLQASRLYLSNSHNLSAKGSSSISLQAIFPVLFKVIFDKIFEYHSTRWRESPRKLILSSMSFCSKTAEWKLIKFCMNCTSSIITGNIFFEISIGLVIELWKPFFLRFYNL